MESPGFTRYSVEARRDEEQRGERVPGIVLWGLIAVACVVIIVFVYLIVSGWLL